MNPERSVEQGHLPIEIGAAMPADADAITDIQIKTILATDPNERAGITYENMRRRVAGEHGEKVAQKVEMWRRDIETRDETHAVFVARQGEQVVGFVAPRFDDQQRRVLGGLYVLPEVQGHGVGSRLLERALQWHGPNQDIYLKVVEYTTAVGFYQRFGFQPTGRRVPLIDINGPPLPRIEMMRSGMPEDSSVDVEESGTRSIPY